MSTMLYSLKKKQVEALCANEIVLPKPESARGIMDTQDAGIFGYYFMGKMTGDKTEYTYELFVTANKNKETADA